MKDIKDYREKELKNYVVGNILLILLLTGKLQEVIAWGSENSFDIWGTIIESVVLSSIIYIYVFIIDSFISGETKYKICYLGIGKKPGYTIFSNMRKRLEDDRFTMEDVLNKYKHIYDNMPEKDTGEYENTNWYSLYESCKNDSKILVSNRDFLLSRDLNIMTIWLFVLYVIATIGLKSLTFSWDVVIVLVVEFFFTNIAMRVKGKRMAYNVISIDILKKE